MKDDSDEAAARMSCRPGAKSPGPRRTLCKAHGRAHYDQLGRRTPGEELPPLPPNLEGS